MEAIFPRIDTLVSLEESKRPGVMRKSGILKRGIIQADLCSTASIKTSNSSFVRENAASSWKVNATSSSKRYLL
jgi:hypothetical protein